MMMNWLVSPLVVVAGVLVCTVCAQSILVEECQPPDPHSYCSGNQCAPEDRLIGNPGDTCHTNFRFMGDHVYNSEWEVMFDSYDYPTLVGSALTSREFDNDGDVSMDKWANQGGICQYNLRACAWSLGPQDNWLFSRHIKYPPGSTTEGFEGGQPTEISFQVSYRFTQCSGDCTNNYFNLYRYDTDSIASDSDQTNRYIPFFGTGTETTTSRFQQEGRSTVFKTVPYVINSPSSDGFYFGIRDSGTCGSINRFIFYYTPCKALQDGLVNYPELVRPPTGSSPNVGQACCAPNSHNTTSLDFIAHDSNSGLCERNVSCECDSGYRLNSAGTGCEVCLAGTYRSSTDDQTMCQPCPLNTEMDEEGAAICNCMNGYFRDEQTNEGPEVACTPPSSVPEIPDPPTSTSTTITVTWTRPADTGRPDFYYSIEYTDPDSGMFVVDDGRYVNTGLTASYTITGLLPFTPYTVRVTSHNGVSDQDPENEALRQVTIQTRTAEGAPSPPRGVRVFSGVVVWGSPESPNGVIIGYELRFTDSSSRTTTVSKLASDSFHVVTDDDIRGLGTNIQVQVRARTSVDGLYSAAIPYTDSGISCPTPTPCPTTPVTTCPPTTSPTVPVTTCPPPPPPPPPPCPETPGLYFNLSGRTYCNDDIVFITDIGDSEDALLCMTDNTNCCNTQRIGEFYYPDDSLVDVRASGDSFYRNRGDQLIRLNRRNGVTSPLGRYRCDIPDATGTISSININIATTSILTPTTPMVTDCPTSTTPTPCPEVSCPPTLAPTMCPTPPPCPTSSPCTEVTCPTCPPVTTEICTPCPSTLPPQQDTVYFMLGGRTYFDNDTIFVIDIGEGDNALLCVTEYEDCCTAQTTIAGEFYYPDGSLVGVRASGDSFYRNRGDQLIRLNRRNGATSPLGRYRCDIPDAMETTRSVHVNIILGDIPSCPPPTCPPLPTCPPPPVTCPSLFSPANGGVSVTRITVGGRATYSCNTGYTLSGSSSRTCQSNGVWSGSAPTCQAVECPSLTSFTNGRVTVTRRTFEGIAAYVCNTGYTLSGSSSRVCLSSGSWSGSAPTCQAVQCLSLTNPSNGGVSVTRRTVGGRATYSCNPGYTLSGSSSRTCQSNGVWSGSAPFCQQNPSSTCPPPPLEQGVYFSLGGRTYTDGDTVLITDIGEGDNALFCMTDSTNCCTDQTTLAGEFYYPDDSLVGIRASRDSFYRNRGPQVVRLNRRNGATSPLGRYRCDIPDASETTRSIYINIAGNSDPICPTTSTPTTCPPPTPDMCPTCPPQPPTPTRCPEVTCPPTSCPPTSTDGCPVVTCLPPPTCPPTTTSTDTLDRTRPPPTIIIPTGNLTNGFDVTYAGNNICVVELGKYVAVVSETESITISMRVFSAPQTRKRQVETDYALDVNVTIPATENFLQVPLESELTNDQMYTAQASLIVDNEIMATTAPFTFTYTRDSAIATAFSSQSAAAIGYVDGVYIAVAIVLTFLVTAVIVALLVVVLSWLFITLRIKSGRYTVSDKKQQLKY